MSLKYGFIKCTVVGGIRLKGTRRKRETQYHLHAEVDVPGTTGTWDVAVNVGTNDADDLLRYRLAFDYDHPILEQLTNTEPGVSDLTGSETLPALDFLRSDMLDATGKWRDSDVMDGSDDREPYTSLARLLNRAQANSWTTYVFGRFYVDGTNGIHDIHMNQGKAHSSTVRTMTATTTTTFGRMVP